MAKTNKMPYQLWTTCKVPKRQSAHSKPKLFVIYVPPQFILFNININSQKMCEKVCFSLLFPGFP